MAGIGRALVAASLLVSVGGCATRLPRLVSGPEAYRAFPAPRADRLPVYRIGAFDRIAVSVYQEDDLSVRDVQVDSAGDVLLPLIGQVHAAGLTSSALAAEVAGRLGARYLVDPQVSVIVQDSVSQKVTVEGSVIEPGVYGIQGRTTLLDAIAMAKGTTRVAALNDAVVIGHSDIKAAWRDLLTAAPLISAATLGVRGY